MPTRCRMARSVASCALRPNVIVSRTIEIMTFFIIIGFKLVFVSRVCRGKVPCKQGKKAVLTGRERLSCQIRAPALIYSGGRPYICEQAT